MTTKTYLPPGIDKAPETVPEALAAARAVIEEEGRWTKETWWRHADPEHPEFVDNPYCNGWETCAAGALTLVTIGLDNEPVGRCTCPICTQGWTMVGITHPPGEYTHGELLYTQALEYLADEVQARNGDEERWNTVPRFNDHPATTREDIIAIFRDAEAKATAAAEKVPA